MRFLPVVFSLLLAGCGYVGETLPPALNLPVRIVNLSAVERGSKIVIQFTAPVKTTEGMVLKQPPEFDLRIGPSLDSARRLPNVPNGKPIVRIETPAAEWYGKDVVIGVKALNSRGRDAGWSNLVTLAVIPAPATPGALRVENVAAGVRLTWSGQGGAFRVFRRDASGSPALLATADKPVFTDTTSEYGKSYRYFVQAIAKAGDAQAESEPSEEVTITPEDKFAPAVPTGLSAVISTKSIELVWDRNTEPDLAGYHVFRAMADGPLQLLTGTLDAPSYSDSKVESGMKYRYAVSAIDKLSNESAQSEPVEAVAP